MIRVLICGVGLIFLAATVYKLPAQYPMLYQSQTLIIKKDTLNYRIMYPENFDPSKKYPLILFLHGAGERGNDNQKQLTHGASFFSSPENRKNFPAIVVFPQCAPHSYWANVIITTSAEGNRHFNFQPSARPTKPMQLTIILLEDLLKSKWVDQDRVYIGGLSMGGMGTFELIYRKPKVFAAALIICGGCNPTVINKKAKRVKMWVFHGEEDQVVVPDYSLRMVEAFKNADFEVKLTVYPDVGHNVWDAVFQEPQLLHWLFSNHR